MYWQWCVLPAVLLIGITSGCVSSETSHKTPCIIPQPAHMTVHDGVFHMTHKTIVSAYDDARAEAEMWVDALAPAMGYKLSIVEPGNRDTDIIYFILEPCLCESLGDEGYRLDITPKAVRLRAGKPTGLFYGIQTLRQLLPPAVMSVQPVTQIQWIVPCVDIVDSPRFSWRGLLIDPARHFIPVAEVKRFIDVMALHKFNRLQMHLTDDTGWRVEIKKYPELTRIGSRMDWTQMQWESPSSAQARHSGFYSQQDIRELVRYAAQRHIIIVPEIEMPGHIGAALASYPELSLNPQKLSALPQEQRWKAHEWILTPRPQSIAFMSAVLSEIMDLFPSPWIHIGGDEANCRAWKHNEEMQAQMRELGLKNEAELHGWFIRQMDGFLTQHGRRMIGWDEILQGGLASGAVVMSWRGMEGGIAAAQAGHDVIMTPASHTYFDYYQGPVASEPKAWGTILPWEKVLEFEPIPDDLRAAQARHVLGGQGQLWGELISTTRHREYMAWPRSAALAEVLWSPKTENRLESFRTRVIEHLKRFNAADITYRPLQPGDVGTRSLSR